MKMLFVCFVTASVGLAATGPSGGNEPVEINGVQLAALNTLVTNLKMNHEHARIVIQPGTASSVTLSIFYDDSSGFGLLKPQRYSLSRTGITRSLE